MSEIEITQAVRDLAADVTEEFFTARLIRSGNNDSHATVKAIARHRHEARAEALEEAAAMIDKFGDRHERDIAAGLKGTGKRTAHLDACRNIATAIRALRSGEREG